MIGIIAENISNSTITASSENPLITFDTALKDSRLSRTGQTVSCTGQWILFTFSAAVDVDTVAIFGNNFTSGATVKIQGNASDSWASPTVDQALTYTKEINRSENLGRDVGVWSHQFSTTQSYRYWRLYLDDTTNPDEYFEIGFVFLDENTTFPGMSVNQVFKKNTTSATSFSTSGQAYGFKRLQYNGAVFNFPTVTEAQKTTLESFFYKVDIVTPYMLIVWTNNIDVQRPLYVVNASLPEFTRKQESGVTWSFNLEIREVF